MPQLLLELFSEEIPARMQTQAGRDLARMAEERLKAAGLPFESLKTYAGPRRLTLVAEGLPAAQADREEEIKGPRANAPEQALQGFLRKTGLTRADLSERDGVLYASFSQKGRPTPEIIAEMVEAILRGFPWPKSMRWGSGSFRWVRPLKRILCLFDGRVVPFEIEGISSGDLTERHRFMEPSGDLSHRSIKVAHFDQYKTALFDHFVILDQIDRKRIILDGARAVCAAKGVELVEDEGLLEEVSGLAEWPVPVLGDMDPDFLDLPPEVIRTSMRAHQKYFAVRKPGEGTTLAPHFVVVANIAAADGGAVIAAGNAKVLSARLSDARFFWTEDRKTPLEDRLETLKGVTFHAKLGTMYERVERIEALAREIAPLVGANPDLAAKAARLAKADLATGMVGEFPELQGVMGGYYARLEPWSSKAAPEPSPPLRGRGQGEGGAGADIGQGPADTPTPDPSPQGGGEQWFDGLSTSEVDQIADAVRDHYKPVGPSDSVPTAPVTVAVAVADKLDTLVGFFAIDEKPTGSRDPFALRRAALGVIRLMLENRISLPLVSITANAVRSMLVVRIEDRSSNEGAGHNSVQIISPIGQAWRIEPVHELSFEVLEAKALAIRDEVAREAMTPLRHFFAERLSGMLRDEGKRYDLVYAVFALGDDDLVRIVARVEALSGFLATEDGATLLAGYKRAVNILKAEEKKSSLSPGGRGVGGEGVARDGLGKGGGGGASGELSGAVTANTPIPDPSPFEGEGGPHLNPPMPENAPLEEAALAAALQSVQTDVDTALAAEDFTAAMRHLARLRAPVDAFFDKVLVNDPDPAVRLNRLRLLTQVRDTANRVADFSLISG